MGMKIAIIGAGSSYTPEIVDGLLDVRAFMPLEVALYDLPEGRERAQTVCSLAGRMARKRGADAAFHVAESLSEAVVGCRFVVSQFRVGLLEARIHDEKMPLPLDLLGQETTGAGGFCKAMRTIPAALEVAREMEKSSPDAWLINFTNPSGIITEAVQRHSRIRCVGLCNVPYNMRVDAARILEAPVERVRLKMTGLNHLSFVTEIWLDGTPVLQRLIDEGRFSAQLVKNIPKVDGVEELIRTLRMVPSPYLQYYYFEKTMLGKERADIAEGRGTRGEQILRVQDDLFNLYRDPALADKPKELEMRGGAYYSTVATLLMQALAGANELEMPVCCRNGGSVPELEDDAVVEINALINASGVHPLAAGHLPAAVRGLVEHVKAYESLTVEAAVEHSRSKAVQALLSHPLIHGYENAVKVVDDLAQTFAQYVGRLE